MGPVGGGELFDQTSSVVRTLLWIEPALHEAIEKQLDGLPFAVGPRKSWRDVLRQLTHGDVEYLIALLTAGQLVAQAGQARPELVGLLQSGKSFAIGQALGIVEQRLSLG